MEKRNILFQVFENQTQNVRVDFAVIDGDIVNFDVDEFGFFFLMKSNDALRTNVRKKNVFGWSLYDIDSNPRSHPIVQTLINAF